MHKTVLLKEGVESLSIKQGATIVDATLGAGGHTIELAKAVGENGRIIAFDLDQAAIDEFKIKIKKQPELAKRIFLKRGNFKDVLVLLKKLNVQKVDGILADLGWRIEQVQDPQYGMSFFQDARLNMRLDQFSGENAFDVINNFSQSELTSIFWRFGGEKKASVIAKKIVERRKVKTIETTTELASLVETVSGRFPRRRARTHPATKVFQALRIFVNQELENLKIFLTDSLKILNKNGRLAIISFHSLEDRIVKDFFRENARGCVCPKELPICVCQQKQKLKIITKKPIKPTQAELDSNQRARSARLRVAMKV
ncbi:MAG TPA: 16S rRNA (cytosine(1402)-N(4))-methyltransferase RsmH [Candidatus Moranbacteria bacterium]|nr:16S rRNA (cytosine(1402)-N(4))-methyltransferase RsmH [Candidatus Moranbacteria bacterium]